MSTRWTEKDLSRFESNSGRRATAANVAKAVSAKPRKYKNQPVKVDGIKFHSKLEAARYQELVLLRKAGQVRNFWRQVPFDLAGVTWRCDFLVEWATDLLARSPITVEDAKGFLTRQAARNHKQVKELYGLDVILVRAAQS